VALAVGDGAATEVLEDGAAPALGVADGPAELLEIGGKALGLGACSRVSGVARLPLAAQAATTPRLASANRHFEAW